MLSEVAINSNDGKMGLLSISNTHKKLLWICDHLPIACIDTGNIFCKKALIAIPVP